MSRYYTIKNIPVKEVSLRLASHLLTLPDGAWPETQSAEVQLEDTLPSGVSVDEMLEFAARHNRYVHQSRIDWLRGLGQKYAMADQAKAYPALGPV